MLKSIVSGIQCNGSLLLQKLTLRCGNSLANSPSSIHSLAAVCTQHSKSALTFSNGNFATRSLLCPMDFGPLQQLRTIIKYDWENGERETCMAVVKRFTKLHWGGWIRPRATSGKKLWTKRADRVHKASQFLLCSRKQGLMLDKMTTTYYRYPRFYPDDPLRPYQSRESCYGAHRKPLPTMHEQLPPPSPTRDQMEADFYKATKFLPEVEYKRPMHKRLK